VEKLKEKAADDKCNDVTRKGGPDPPLSFSVDDSAREPNSGSTHSKRNRKQPPANEDESNSPVKLEKFKTTKSESTASNDRKPPPLSIGQKIAVHWSEDDEYYPGVVLQQNNPRFKIRYDDGDREWICQKGRKILYLDGSTTVQRADNPNVQALSIGSRVSVWWSAEEQYFAGRVSRFDATKQRPHRIKYDDVTRNGSIWPTVGFDLRTTSWENR